MCTAGSLRCSPETITTLPDSYGPHGLQPTRLLHPWDFPGKSTGVGCHCLLQGNFPTQGLNPGLPHCRQTLYHLSHLIPSLSLIDYAAKLLQSCLTLCDPIDGSPPGSTVPGILQARTLEWVAISLSKSISSNCISKLTIPQYKIKSLNFKVRKKEIIYCMESKIIV